MSGLVDSIFGGSSKAPDYGPMAAASEESARIGAELGREQLAENKRQYENNMAVAKPIIDAQGKQMQLAYDQGKATFDAYQTEGRPLQQAMRDDAMGITSEAKQRVMDEAANTAVADARAGTTQQMNQLARTGMRYGWSPAKIAAMGASGGTQGAALQVAAANGARTQAGDKYYAKMGDTFNTYSGMASQAPSFYGAGTQAGSSAVSNQNGTSGQYISGMTSGNGTIMQGQQQRIGGLGSLISTQASASSAARGQNMDMFGTGAGMFFSDQRLKKDVVKLRDDPRGFGWYEFEYLWGGGRKVGVMAQELEKVIPDAVGHRGGYKVVNYAMF